MRLHLLRHAKSSWKDESLADRDRPLAGRGRRAAAAMAEHFAAQGIVPGLVLCSTAVRTHQTYARLELGDVPVRYEPGIYGASADELLTLLRTVPDTVDTLLMIGHNPGLEDLALLLARPSTSASARRSGSRWWSGPRSRTAGSAPTPNPPCRRSRSSRSPPP